MWLSVLTGTDVRGRRGGFASEEKDTEVDLLWDRTRGGSMPLNSVCCAM